MLYLSQGSQFMLMRSSIERTIYTGRRATAYSFLIHFWLQF
jgi:hypothetical protein